MRVQQLAGLFAAACILEAALGGCGSGAVDTEMPKQEILLVGDSIAAGVGVTSNRHSLQGRLARARPEWFIFNVSRGGLSVARLHSQLAGSRGGADGGHRCHARGPDFMASVPLDTFRARYEAIAAKAIDLRRNLVCVTPIWTGKEDTPDRSNLQGLVLADYRKAITEVCKAHWFAVIDGANLVPHDSSLYAATGQRRSIRMRSGIVGWHRVWLRNERRFTGEISTPGCAIIMPVELRSFLMICGDGTLQLIELDAKGGEVRRERSEPFFDVQRDPLFGLGLHTGSGWLLVTNDGLVREVRAAGGRIEIGESWSMLNDDDRADGDEREQWRPGGQQPLTLHRGASLLYALMHKGKVDTHGADGEEVWVFDIERHKRVARLRLPVEASRIHATQEAVPRLILVDKDDKLQIYDGLRLNLQRTIEEPGPTGSPALQALAPHD